VINGTALPKETTQRNTPDSSPDVPPNPKRARVDLIEHTSPPLAQMDKAFNELADKAKALKAQDDQRKAYLRRIEDLTVDSARVVKIPDRVDKMEDDVMTSAYSQSLRDNANLLVMTKDARSLKSAGQEISGDKKEFTTRGLNKSSSSAQQVYQSDDGGYNEPGPPMVTKDQRDKSLTMWKEALIKSNGYAPRLNLQAKEHAQNISFLIAAMVAFRNAKRKGELTHGNMDSMGLCRKS
jgi:hypothetical protein